MKKNTLLFVAVLLIFCIPFKSFSQDLNKGLLAYWSFDSDDNKLNDNSGYSHHGALKGAKINTNSKQGKCLAFDGNSNVEISEGINLYNSFSVVFWVKIDNSQNSLPIFSQFDTVDGKRIFEFGIDLKNPAKEVIYMRTPQKYAEYSTKIPKNEWFLVAYVVDGCELKIYNSCSGTSTTQSIKLDVRESQEKDKAFLGLNVSQDKNFKGALDEFMIYDRPLTKFEITQICDNNLPTKQTSIARMPNIKLSDCPDPPTNIRDTPIKYGQTVTVNSLNFYVRLYDDANEDGDIVSVNINGVWIVENYTLKNRDRATGKIDKEFQITLQPNTEYYLISYAHNEGTQPTNTLAIEIEEDGKKPYTVSIHSSARTSSGAIKIVYAPK